MYEARRARRPHGRRREHHVLPRAASLPADGSRACARDVRAAALFLLQPLRVGSDWRAALDSQSRPEAAWTSMRPRPVAGSSRATASTCSSITSGLDFASHQHGPDGVREALVKTDASVGVLVAAAGGIDDFLERYAVARVLRPRADARPPCGQAPGSRARAGDRHRLEPRRDDLRRRTRGRLASARRRVEAVEVALFLEDGEVVARSHGDEDSALLDSTRDGRERVEAALRNPNAGEVLVSAAPGWEFADLAGLHHAGGGSHGSLAAGRLRGADAGDRARRAARARRSTSRRRMLASTAGSRHARAVIDGRNRHGGAAACGAWRSRRARAGGDGARAARALRAGGAARACATRTSRCRSAAGRRSRSRAWSHVICELLALRGDERVLDVGTGSGYQAAVLAELAAEVHSIERIPELAEQARAEPRGGGLPDRVIVHVGDGTLGDPGARAVRGDRGRRRGARAAALAVGAARAGGRAAGGPGRAAVTTSCSSSIVRGPDGPRLSRRSCRAASSRSSARRASTAAKRAHVMVRGRVQGVGFRYATGGASSLTRRRRLGAQQRRRHGRGGVRGAAGRVDRLVAWCRRGPAGARVDDVTVESEEPSGERGFRRGLSGERFSSDEGARRRVASPPSTHERHRDRPSRGRDRRPRGQSRARLRRPLPRRDAQIPAVERRDLRPRADRRRVAALVARGGSARLLPNRAKSLRDLVPVLDSVTVDADGTLEVVSDDAA